jgi:Zn ribbon nucleic-acid-binding protein
LAELTNNPCPNRYCEGKLLEDAFSFLYCVQCGYQDKELIVEIEEPEDFEDEE